MRTLKLLAILFAAAWLLVFCTKGNAQEAIPKSLQNLIKGHAVIYVGTCNVDKNNDLTDKPNKVVAEVNCVITVKETDQDHHYVIIGNDKAAERLVKVNPATMKQTLIWGKKHPLKGGKAAKQGVSV